VDKGGQLQYMTEERKAELRAMNEMFTPEEVAEAITANGGWISKTAKALGCTPETISRYSRRYPIVAEARATALAGQDDIAEQSLIDLVKEKNPAATIFYAKTRLRERGYSEKVTIEVVPFALQQRLVELCNERGIAVEDLMQHMVDELEHAQPETIVIEQIEDRS
jgi:transposase-like protein